MKFACKENMDRFVAMDEEEQKDFLFFMLDAMDEVAVAIDDEDDEDEKEIMRRYFRFYQAMVPFFLDDMEWMKEVGLSQNKSLREWARRMRAERRTEENEA